MRMKKKSELNDRSRAHFRSDSLVLLEGQISKRLMMDLINLISLF